MLQKRQGGIEILAFVHPLAGKQIVKGTLEPGESLQAACIRELYEEAGLTATPVRDLGPWASTDPNQVWGFCLMACSGPLADRWDHYTQDDGGHIFQFFWQSLDEQLDDDWHPLFKGAIGYIRQTCMLE
jgi:8-oxo-dGTP pyrophosphatase MutT (NUDIX family)